jgi:hypothetical protein
VIKRGADYSALNERLQKMQMQKVWPLDEVKADWARVKCEVAWVRMLFAARDYRMAVERSGKFNPYRDDAGRFTTADGVGGGAAGTSNGAKPERPAEVQVALADPRIDAALALLTFLYGQRIPRETPYIQFNARAFVPGVDNDAAAIHVGSLTREDVDGRCPRHGEVQTLTDEAKVKVEQEGNYWGATAKGTRIHIALKRSIDDRGDDNFRAEVSAIKSDAAGYGKRDSVRVDVLENVGDGTVCVYDIKTGKSILTRPRMQEIANNVHSYYP